MALDPLLILIDILAVYRLTRLIVKDTLLQEARWWILRRWPSELTTYPDVIVEEQRINEGMVTGLVQGRTPVYLSTSDSGEDEWRAIKVFKWTELVECVYCASVWVAFAVLALRVWWDWWQWPALGLAIAGVVALIFSRLDTD